MNIIEFIEQYIPWSWIVGGLVLLAIELIVPGGVFVWLGLAAIITGLSILVFPISFAWQWVLFGILSIAGVAIWLKFGRRASNEITENPFLNRRAERLIGREVVLKEAINQGVGRVKIDDTTWRVAGPDLAKGKRVKIVGHDGAILRVEEA